MSSNFDSSISSIYLLKSHIYNINYSGFTCGLAFGITSAIVGQPFDIIKTKMQAQSNMTAYKTLTDVIKTNGIKGLFKGLIPPLLGISIFRSVQFGVYNGSYSYLGEKNYNQTIPFTNGLPIKVVAASFLAATFRSLVENPIEYVRQMTGQPWHFKSVYTGLWPLWLRTIGLVGSFHVIVDYTMRLFPEICAIPVIGPFFKGGIMSTLSWAFIWPFEIVKNQIQAGVTEGPTTVVKRILWLIKKNGLPYLFRGFLPGGLRGLVANGAAMMVMDICQASKGRNAMGEKADKL